MKALAPNTLIQNRYLLVQLVGKGGMGEVYLAVDQRLGSAVALKRTFFADDQMLGNAFEREAKILARLRHPVLPKVSDHFAENGEQYLVMEHIAGDDLSKRLELSQKAFPLSWVLFWADQLLDALSYLHSHEPPIIHRDIKPQNLKLTDENHIVLLDFGLSKNSTGQTNISSSATSGSVVGYTPHYAPMEQIRGTGTSPRSDIYALSATLYQLMTNTVPADALTRADALLNEMPDPIKPLNEVDPEISPAVSEVILKGMEVSQEKRWPNAREMQKALRKAFSQIQEAMSANTVAFNVNPEFAGGSIPPSNVSMQPAKALGDYSPKSELKTELTSQPGALVQAPFDASVDNGATDPFDATIRSDAEVVEAPVRQSDLKTEVFLAGDAGLGVGSDEPGPVTPSYDSEPRYGEQPDPGRTEDFGFEDRQRDPGVVDATAPAIAFAGGEDVVASAPEQTNYYTREDAEYGAGPYDRTADHQYTDNYSPGEPEYSPGEPEETGYYQREEPDAQQAAYVEPQKKGSSKALIVVGGIAALFILSALAVGAGWFIYSNMSAGTTDPSPSPSPSAEPSVAPTLETALEPDNSNSGLEPGSNANVSTVEPTPVPTAEPIREQPADTPGTVRPSPTVRKTPVRVTPTPGVKRTPTPKTPGNRTIILQ